MFCLRKQSQRGCGVSLRGRNRVAVGNIWRMVTRGSAFRTTPGFRTESRWDSLLRVSILLRNLVRFFLGLNGQPKICRSLFEQSIISLRDTVIFACADQLKINGMFFA